MKKPLFSFFQNEDSSSLELAFDICFEWEVKRIKYPKSREVSSWNELDAFGIMTENL